MRAINVHPGRGGQLVLAALPLILLVALYLWGSAERLAVNPQDKLLPRPASFITAMQALALTPDQRTGAYLFWTDTGASLTRLGGGVAIAATLGLVVGTGAGAIPVLGALLGPLLAILSMVPALALMPVLLIVAGTGEAAKVTLIALGIFPFIARDLAFRAREMPEELLIKAQTMGGTSLQIVLRVILPLLLPKLIAAVRLSLGSAWLFLIAAEAIIATEGLGYRIFLVRRFLAMDVILPYVAWITLLAFLLDQILAQASRRLYPWAGA